ncbi:MAG TPA: hypothetical protein PKG69_05970 [Methanoregulaceae archaeon]|nr:hypothetical protein [Methanoregulaceae archaeon]
MGGLDRCCHCGTGTFFAISSLAMSAFEVNAAGPELTGMEWECIPGDTIDTISNTQPCHAGWSDPAR